MQSKVLIRRIFSCVTFFTANFGDRRDISTNMGADSGRRFYGGGRPKTEQAPYLPELAPAAPASTAKERNRKKHLRRRRKRAEEAAAAVSAAVSNDDSIQASGGADRVAG